MKVFAVVQCGLEKAQCEDSVIIGNKIVCDDTVEYILDSCGAVCIADGVGGNAGGHIASVFALEQLKSFQEPSDVVNEKVVCERLISINNSLLEEGARDGFPEMATTLTGLICNKDKKYLVHIGNTRAYVLQGRYLKQLTVDHTVYNRLLKMGRVDEASQCNKNEITNCLGGKDASLAAAISVTPLQPFSLLLLTSDGAHDFVSIDELESYMTVEADDQEKCNNILQAARNAGSMDDISVVIISSQGE